MRPSQRTPRTKKTTLHNSEWRDNVLASNATSPLFRAIPLVSYSGTKTSPSFPCVVGEWPGKRPKKQGVFIPTEPLESLEKEGKTLKKPRSSSQGEKTRNSQKTRQGRTGQEKGAFEEGGVLQKYTPLLAVAL